MNRFTLVLATGAVLGYIVLSGCDPSGTALADRRPFQRGVAFTGYSRAAYDGDGALRAMDELRATNAAWTSILVTGYQETIHSTEILFDVAPTPYSASVEGLIAYARRSGLKVLLKPHVDPKDSRWRGEIGPDFTAADWQAWFSSYREFILHYAQMAARTDCELFCVGCELNTTVSHEAEWRGIIADVRKIYKGPLVYADDQAEHKPEAVVWWDALDFIGQDAYPTLSQKTDPTIEDLCRGWLEYRAKLQALAQKWNKSLIITEIGYRSITGGTVNPWDWQREGPVDLDLQRRAYEAAFRMISGQSWVAGIYWWQWMPDPDHGGPADTGYSPHGKPAESVLRSWFGKSL